MFLCILTLFLLKKLNLLFSNLIKTVIDLADKYTTNSKYFVWIIVKISLIISLVVVYLVVISDSIFSEKVINVYNFLSTVILIPLLLSSFDRKSKKIRN